MNIISKYTKSITLNTICIAAAFAVTMVLSYSCDEVRGVPEEYPVKDKTVLVYMVGNNNLSGTAEVNLADIQEGFIPQQDKGNILVYHHIAYQDPVLLNVIKQEDGKVVADTVYKFPKRNSATAQSLTNAMQVTKTLFPATEYGLILWSHGTGWLPQGAYSKTRSFGSEEGKEINIPELVKALPYRVSYVIFDACLMGGIETAYELKDSTDHVLFSPTEVLAAGFPYSKIMQPLFSSPTDLEGVAREYYNHYNSMSGEMRSATVSLVKTSELDAVAAAAKTVFDEHRDKIATLNMNHIQPYFRFNKHWFYDLEDFISQIASPEQADTFKQALNKAVVYKATTPYFLEIPIVKYSGISTYIPNPADEELDKYYKNFAWNKACGMIE